MNCSTPEFPVLHCLPELAQTHVRWLSAAIPPSHPLSPPALNLSQHQGLSQWVSFSHQVAKVLELQLQPQPFQWIFKVDFPYYEQPVLSGKVPSCLFLCLLLRHTPSSLYHQSMLCFAGSQLHPSHLHVLRHLQDTQPNSCSSHSKVLFIKGTCLKSSQLFAS